MHKFLECLFILFFAFMIFRQKQDVPERVSPPPLERLLIIRNTGGLAASASVQAGWRKNKTNALNLKNVAFTMHFWRQKAFSKWFFLCFVIRYCIAWTACRRWSSTSTRPIRPTSSSWKKKIIKIALKFKNFDRKSPQLAKNSNFVESPKISFCKFVLGCW